MSKGKNGKSAGQATENVNVAELLARLDALKADIVAVSGNKADAPAKVGNGKKAKDAPEAWKTAGKSAENVEANLYARRVSVQVQQSSKGREQVHIYTQSLIPAERVRNSAGLDTVKAKDKDGKTVAAVWVNNPHPIIVRQNAKDAADLMGALIKNAAK